MCLIKHPLILINEFIIAIYCTSLVNQYYRVVWQIMIIGNFYLVEIH
jgi:hypothetical protein